MKRFRKFIRLFCVAAAGFLVVAAQTKQPPPPPEQPIPFSHKQHAGTLKLKCETCHRNPDPGEKMTFAPPATCMQCHSEVKTDSPAIQKLAAHANDKREIKWARVYEIPSYIFFSHRAHLAAGGACVDCHGQVRERERLYREVEVSMASCMNCHQAKGASVDCVYCHDKLN